MTRATPVETYGLTHAALAVRDPATSLAFYQAVLGVVAVYQDEGFVQAQTPGQPRRSRVRAQAGTRRTPGWRGASRLPAHAGGRHREGGGGRRSRRRLDRESGRVRARGAVRVLPRSRRLRDRDRYRSRRRWTRPTKACRAPPAVTAGLKAGATAGRASVRSGAGWSGSCQKWSRASARPGRSYFAAALDGLAPEASANNWLRLAMNSVPFTAIGVA